MSKKLILFTLQTFSTTGGVQKMARTLGHALHKLSLQENIGFSMWSLYDKKSDLMEQYVPGDKFIGFGHKRISFSLKIIGSAFSYHTIILGHINMAAVGLMVKMLNPKCKIIMIAHGIEVWRPLSWIKSTMLKHCDKILCVSNFTRTDMISRHGCDADRCVVINNAIDPFIKLPESFSKPDYLLQRYGLNDEDKIIFTLTRLAYTEQYKGYEQVIKAVSKLKTDYPAIKYILSGEYDSKEELRIKKLISDYWVTDNVILTGFVNEKELSDYFLLADMFVLPSKKEGFGIVFIEAMACGLPVICGNADGSIDAIQNGELGKAINADSLDELHDAMAGYLSSPLTPAGKKQLQTDCLSYFNEEAYITKLQRLLPENLSPGAIYNE